MKTQFPTFSSSDMRQLLEHLHEQGCLQAHRELLGFAKECASVLAAGKYQLNKMPLWANRKLLDSKAGEVIEVFFLEHKKFNLNLVHEDILVNIPSQKKWQTSLAMYSKAIRAGRYYPENPQVIMEICQNNREASPEDKMQLMELALLSKEDHVALSCTKLLMDGMQMGFLEWDKVKPWWERRFGNQYQLVHNPASNSATSQELYQEIVENINRIEAASKNPVKQLLHCQTVICEIDFNAVSHCNRFNINRNIKAFDDFCDALSDYLRDNDGIKENLGIHSFQYTSSSFNFIFKEDKFRPSLEMLALTMMDSMFCPDKSNNLVAETADKMQFIKSMLMQAYLQAQIPVGIAKNSRQKL